jgi:transposase
LRLNKTLKYHQITEIKISESQSKNHKKKTKRGFGFLKDPLFFADGVFLKSPKRIETMGMLMGLCLMVFFL